MEKFKAQTEKTENLEDEFMKTEHRKLESKATPERKLVNSRSKSSLTTKHAYTFLDDEEPCSRSRNFSSAIKDL